MLDVNILFKYSLGLLSLLNICFVLVWVNWASMRPWYRNLTSIAELIRVPAQHLDMVFVNGANNRVTRDVCRQGRISGHIFLHVHDPTHNFSCVECGIALLGVVVIATLGVW